jgi:two-component system, sensor histidine kinase
LARDVGPRHGRVQSDGVFAGALIATHGSGAVPILIAGLLLSWAAAPGWTELVLMWPDRGGGDRRDVRRGLQGLQSGPREPHRRLLLVGWVPTCGFTAILSAAALHQWYLPFIPVTPLAVGIILIFLAINLLGVRAVTRVAIPVACTAALLALLSAVVR